MYRSALPLLYSRTNYKLFLNAAVADVDLRVQQLASLADYFSPFLRPVPLRAPFGESMLVVAPHQDDEVIGCGGALALQVRSGRKAFVVLVQDGGGEYQEAGLSRPAMCELRNEESRRAVRMLGIDPPQFLGHPEVRPAADRIAASFRQLISERNVDVIFTPWLLDGHPDHREVNYALAQALADLNWKGRVLGYEVWGLCIPNVIVPIDEVMDLKVRMLACYDFANKALDYVNSTKGLNMYRSRLLAAGTCSHAECFFEAPAEEFISLAGRVKAVERC